ncbi:MAG: gluconate 2-dehydrogenase subunit 3 family protein [Nitrospirales bacterium]|nr:gluconate 2-dehydrogenase subunit 3 family protein [Nitrospirales bacterium]
MRITPEELDGYMRNWDEQTRGILLMRMEERFRRNALEHFSIEEAGILEAALGRMVPQEPGEQIDLVGFVDWAVGKPLGRGDRQEGLPSEEILFSKGIAGIQETAREMFKSDFTVLKEHERDEVLTTIQEGSAKGRTWEEIPSRQFFIKLLIKAVTGYCAHPFAWMRMGFPGPSYPEGYVWITRPEIRARRRHFPGWKTF